MTRREVEPPIHITMFDDSTQFNQFLLSNRMGYGIGTAAKGKIAKNGSIEVAINRSFLQQGGIGKDQLLAVIEHERIELTTKAPDPHLAATVGEYQYILKRFGEKGLKEYHVKLCNLYGGLNYTRNQALRTVLENNLTPKI